MGEFQLKRYSRSPTGPPSLRRGCGLTSICCRVRMSVRTDVRRSGLGLERALLSASDGYVETAPVGSHPQGRGAGGLEDMAGNVAEWTRDALSDPSAGERGATEDVRAVRGASFHSTRAQEVDPAFVRRIPATYHPHDVGLRCAADPEG